MPVRRRRGRGRRRRRRGGRQDHDAGRRHAQNSPTGPCNNAPSPSRSPVTLRPCAMSYVGLTSIPDIFAPRRRAGARGGAGACSTRCTALPPPRCSASSAGDGDGGDGRQEEGLVGGGCGPADRPRVERERGRRGSTLAGRHSQSAPRLAPRQPRPSPARQHAPTADAPVPRRPPRS